ncbi:MAG: DUF1569 domain-containing protein [Phycisphaerales bacterium]|nr:DUF1569 domain-containing protein [Phycisphaerales bacterium]
MNPASVADFRRLTFRSIDDVRRELDLLEEAFAAGTLRSSGNWTAGQNISHLAAFIEYGFDGYPPELTKTPWIIRVILKRMKNRFLYHRMKRGVYIPRVKGGTVGADDAPFDVAAGRLRAGLDRLEASVPTASNPIFGPMTHDEWKSLQLRHCELHLGYLHPR